jgi:hypothetical protein
MPIPKSEPVAEAPEGWTLIDESTFARKEWVLRHDFATEEGALVRSVLNNHLGLYSESFFVLPSGAGSNDPTPLSG